MTAIMWPLLSLYSFNYHCILVSPSSGASYLVFSGCKTRKSVHAKATAVTTSQVDQGEIDEGLSKNQCKKLAKVAAQTAQIKDLQVKLDSAVAENMQMWEYLDPKTFQACITNAVQEAQQTASQTNMNTRYTLHQSWPIHGHSVTSGMFCWKGQHYKSSHANTCKDTRHELPNCLRLQKKKDLEAAWAASQASNLSN